MKVSLKQIIRILIFYVVVFFPLQYSHAALDKWGGDDRVKNPFSKYQTETATSTGNYTLTDTSRSWMTNELRGSILQPNTNREVYFLIKSNTSNTIEVYGSTNDGDQDRSYRQVDDENSGSEQYAVLDRWSVQKINQRWWLFDPYGNSFFIKSLNGFNYETSRYGNDVDGNSFCNNLQSKNGAGNCHTAHAIEIDVVKSMGINAFGEVVDTFRMAPGAPYDPGSKTSDRLLPFISFIRVSSLTLDSTDSMSMGAISASVWDAHDPDFQTDIQNNIESDSGARNEGMKNFDANSGQRTYWADRYLTPYRDMEYNIPANPYYIGIDWDEEPSYLRSEHNNAHMGYYILTSGTSTARKQAAVNWLQTQYASMGDLNTAWGTSFSSWVDLQNDTGSKINPALSTEPYCRDYGGESNTTMKEDLDGVAANFWRTYAQKVKAAIDNKTGGFHMLNFGPGYHGWTGSSNDGFDGQTSPVYLFNGSVSEDGNTPYVDIIGVGDPMHSAHTSSADSMPYMRDDLVDRYAFHGRPYWHESCWVTAEADSGIAFTGTINTLSSTVLSDGYDFRTSNGWTSALTGLFGPWVLPDSSLSMANWQFFRIASVANGSITVNAQVGNGNNWSYDSSPTLTSVASNGDTYVIVHHDLFLHISGGSFDLWLPLTQAERAALYTQFLDDLIQLQADNGDYIDVGYSHWEFFDYAHRNGSYEFRNWGFETVKGELYNGSDAKMADGVTTCGNFTGPVSSKLLGIYDDILQQGPPAPPKNLIITN